MVEPCSISLQYIMKQLEYATKGHIAMHKILFKLKGFTLQFLSGTCITDITLLVTRNCLSVAQASSSFKCLNTCTLMYAAPTFITEGLCRALSCYLCTVVLNDCKSEVMVYTVLPCSYHIGWFLRCDHSCHTKVVELV